jgi:agmatinase
MSSFDPDAPAAPGSGFFGLDTPAEGAAVWILSVPFDATTSFRGGAAHGPAAMRAASHQVDLYDLRFGRPWQAGIHTLAPDPQVVQWNEQASAAARPVIDAGGVPAGDPRTAEVDRIGELLTSWVREQTGRALSAGALPVLVGGDHSVPLGAIAACAERHPGLGILHLDAHADLRPAYEGFAMSHASILHNVLEQVPGVEQVVMFGIRDLGQAERARIDEDPRLSALFDPRWARHKLAGGNLQALVREHLDRLPAEVYLTFDIDGLEPALCPRTGTPVPGGINWHELMLWLEQLVASGRRIVGCDLCEVSPGPGGDPRGEGWDGIVGSRLLYRMIGAALAGRGKD